MAFILPHRDVFRHMSTYMPATREAMTTHLTFISLLPSKVSRVQVSSQCILVLVDLWTLLALEGTYL
jgi:hypothetical protein